MIIIRKFRPSDMFSVIKLASETLTEQYEPSLFNFFYESYPEGFIVAEKDHKIIGFIIGVKTTIKSSRILMLSVSEKYRRQKIGSTLLNEFLKIMSNEKVKYVELEVKVDNTKAKNFYMKHGFKIKGKIEKFYQDGKSAYTMIKFL
ncbi:MAG: ribosomal protein S18-alanine N-acetyltransferase [Candidatus Thermoplasmatota archaeon]|nr:ribosomal protein S18-alanine N-acetyltransferase [Candidatus Thermoplasmatota archaeon]